jgi:precorrin-6A/cobalt-precorrin-6A reductase
MKILVVGGTADGRHLTSALFESGFDVTYSIAGIVRKATMPCPVISGGFTQFGGLAQYVLDNHITHLIDATHPFAQKMSNKISLVSGDLAIAAIRFHRPEWPKHVQDKWIEVNDWPELITAVNTAKHQSLFMTAGQVTQDVIDALASQAKHVLLRTAMPVKIHLPNNVTWVKAIGPFQLNNEKQLIEQYQIDAIISKNSGGDPTYAKIEAARDLAIPVYQFKRPTLAPTQYQCDNQQGCFDLLKTLVANEYKSNECNQ